MERNKKRRILGTENYILDTAITFGQGAMAKVVLARHRKKGKVYAAKMFSEQSERHYRRYIQNETELHRQIPRNDNIVTLIAVEKEKQTLTNVIILELCNGGSLQQILGKHENMYGLQEDEFFLVMKHTFLAMNHLYKNGILHRDIKPGNILLHISPDGSHVYKLSDFGISKPNPTESKTICGTEEYLHPIIYKAAFDQRRLVESNMVTFEWDMWSYAVTLYQCATGKLPFCPSKGVREDKKKMLQLMTDRKRHVISQVENEAGEIISCNKLPSTTKLLFGTRELVTSVIASIMDGQSPSDFYREMETFFEKKSLSIFSADLCSLFKIYFSELACFGDLLKEVQKTLGSKTKPELIIFDNVTVKMSDTTIDYIEAADNGNYVFCILPEERDFYHKPGNVTDGMPDQFDECSSTHWSTSVIGNMMHFAFLIERCVATQHQLKILHDVLSSWQQHRFQSVQLMWERLKLLDSLKVISSDLSDVFSSVGHKYRELSHKVKESCKPGKLLLPCKSKKCHETTKITVKEALLLYDNLKEGRSEGQNSHNEEMLFKYYHHCLIRYHKTEKDRLITHCMQQTEATSECIKEKIRAVAVNRRGMEELEKRIKECITFYSDNITQFIAAKKESHCHESKRS